MSEPAEASRNGVPQVNLPTGTVPAGEPTCSLEITSTCAGRKRRTTPTTNTLPETTAPTMRHATKRSGRRR